MGIRARLLLSFSGLIVLIGLTGGAGWYYTAELSNDLLEVGSDNVEGTVELAKAEDALWQLRYGFPQYLALGTVEGAHIPGEQSKWFAQIASAVEAYAGGNRTEAEREALKQWREVSGKYLAARPRWFELVEAGKLDEAAEWRARYTTPLGAAAVKALQQLIDLQQETARERIAVATSSAKQARGVLLALVLGAVVLSLTLGALNTRAITRPVMAMAKHFREMGEGRWDLRRHVEVSEIRELAEMASRFNQLLEQMARVIEEVNAGASAVSTAATQVLAASHAVSEGANEQWQASREVTSRLQEIDASIGVTAQTCAQMGESALGAVKSAEASGVSVSVAMRAVREIADHVAIVEDLATQTSILSVNVTIEASSSSETTQRFGALADEVRRLAERSREVARGISATASLSVEAAERSTVALAGLVPSIRGTAELVQSVSSASATQAIAVNQVSQCMTEGNHVTERNAGNAVELSETAREMSSQAEGLRRLISVFTW